MNVGAPELLIIMLVLVLAVAPVILIAWVVTSNSRRPPPPPAVMTVPGAVGTTTVRTGPPTAAGTASSVQGRWYADPTGRFAQRWWDGSRWTADVVLAGGQQTADPAPLPDPPPTPPA
ncbi:MAG: DUF2510 domain-containing protein [Acidimicrobiales bacterium]|nr:DUF2510 domain-containing protein [Acidimicrobiales bacterium]